MLFAWNDRDTAQRKCRILQNASRVARSTWQLSMIRLAFKPNLAAATADGSDMVLDWFVDENCFASHITMFDKSKQGDSIFPQPAQPTPKLDRSRRSNTVCLPADSNASGTGEINGDNLWINSCTGASKIRFCKQRPDSILLFNIQAYQIAKISN